MTKRWTLARSVAGLALASVVACGGDDDASPDAGPVQDGAPPGDATIGDAAVVDCSADHQESAESSNNPFPSGNGSAERTGLSVAAGGAGFTLCGEIDPGQATEQVADYDSFEFTIEGDEPVNLRIEMSAPDRGPAVLALNLFRVNEGPPVELADGPFRNDYALIAGQSLSPGTYWVSALAWLPATEGRVGYSISVRENEFTCPASQETPFDEIADGGDGRGNDMVAVDEADPPPVLTPEPDSPEETGFVLEPGLDYHVRGTSDALPSAGDSYLDRDTYLITTDAVTNELELRLSWPDNVVDLDVYLFEAGSPEIDYSLRLGSTSGHQGELMTLNVEPSRSYWLWVAALDTDDGGAGLPLDYDVTLCAREHGVPPAAPKPP